MVYVSTCFQEIVSDRGRLFFREGTVPMSEIVELTPEKRREVVERFMERNSLGTVIAVWFHVAGRAFVLKGRNP